MSLRGYLLKTLCIGPTIFADWGDRINVTVTNNLRTNGYVILHLTLLSDELS